MTETNIPALTDIRLQAPKDVKTKTEKQVHESR